LTHPPKRKIFIVKCIASLLLGSVCVCVGGFLSATILGAVIGVPIMIAGCIPLAHTIRNRVTFYEHWSRTQGKAHRPRNQRPWEN
jgi:uncharacterized membrane protein HdeD (DUF308 family)